MEIVHKQPLAATHVKRMAQNPTTPELLASLLLIPVRVVRFAAILSQNRLLNQAPEQYRQDSYVLPIH